MTSTELQDIVVAALRRVAPELDPAALQRDAPLRDQVDIDSMDFLNFVVALHERLGVDIPDTDYARLSSVDGIVTYLLAKLEGGARRAGV